METDLQIIEIKELRHQNMVFELYEPLSVKYYETINLFECDLCSRDDSLNYYLTRGSLEEVQDAIGLYLFEVYAKISNINYYGRPINTTLYDLKKRDDVAIDNSKLIDMAADLKHLAKISFSKELWCG